MAVKSVRTCDVFGQRNARRYRLAIIELTELGQEITVHSAEADLSERAVKRAKRFIARSVAPPTRNPVKEDSENVGSDTA